MAFHLYDIVEIYSNEDGTQQFIELHTNNSGQNFLDDHQIQFTNGVTTNTFTFDHDLATTQSTVNTRVLIATEGWVELGLVTPDYFVPNNFLLVTGGTINFGLGQDSVVYSILPTTGNQSENDAGVASLYSPTNFAGDSIMFGTSAKNNMSGGAGKDNMSGLGSADTMSGGVGNDTMNGGGGADRVLGDGGNDMLVYGAGDTLNGGSGNLDTLLIGITSLDLSNNTANPNTRLLNFEQADMRGAATMLKIAKADVLDMSSTSTIKIFGDEGDTVNIVGSQVMGGTAPEGFTRYTIGSAILIIDSSVAVL
jgi:Ca2+-binding RTX toxin-like protein